MATAAANSRILEDYCQSDRWRLTSKHWKQPANTANTANEENGL
jgi:hypothetical protein